jgi:hypothetical protein
MLYQRPSGHVHYISDLNWNGGRKATTRIKNNRSV